MSRANAPEVKPMIHYPKTTWLQPTPSHLRHEEFCRELWSQVARLSSKFKPAWHGQQVFQIRCFAENWGRWMTVGLLLPAYRCFSSICHAGRQWHASWTDHIGKRLVSADVSRLDAFRWTSQYATIRNGWQTCVSTLARRKIPHVYRSPVLILVAHAAQNGS